MKYVQNIPKYTFPQWTLREELRGVASALPEFGRKRSREKHSKRTLSKALAARSPPMKWGLSKKTRALSNGNLRRQPGNARSLSEKVKCDKQGLLTSRSLHVNRFEQDQHSGMVMSLFSSAATFFSSDSKQ